METIQGQQNQHQSLNILPTQMQNRLTCKQDLSGLDELAASLWYH